MKRDAFIQVLEGCIESATGRRYPHIDWTKLSDKGLIQCAELVRDLLEKSVRAAQEPNTLPVVGHIH